MIEEEFKDEVHSISSFINTTIAPLRHNSEKIPREYQNQL